MCSVTRISIITPAFNGERFISGLAASVNAQSTFDWEWIIVNDGSTDGTAALLDGLTDPRIRVVHQANAGASAARNTGLAQARGAYVTFLDVDDRLPPNSLQCRADYLDAHPDVDIVNGGVRVTSQGQELRQYRPDLAQGQFLERLARLDEGVFFGVTYMLRRSCIDHHEFPVGLGHCEDLIFFLTLAHDAKLRYGAVEDVIYEYRIQPGSAMSNLDGIESGYSEMIRHSSKLRDISLDARRDQMRRVRRILVRSWLRRMRPDRALAALVRVCRAARADSAG